VIPNTVVQSLIIPKKIKLELHLSTAELESHYRKAKDPVERSHYQIVWLIAQGKTTAEVMEATGYSRNWIQQLARRYNERGPQALEDHRHQNPGAKDRALLDEHQREELSELLRKPPEDGGMWNSRKVANWIEEQTGRKVRPQRGWEYLRRLANTPKVPRPSHAKADPEEQQAFKRGPS
jgi:transposase